ncbi:MAG: ABC transporter permease [Rhodocyclaceae bacterium]|nr:MAG: ABC transporter permease [Rhodocyclaceae bacterium]
MRNSEMLANSYMAARALLRTPVFTLVTVLMLGMGIGLCIFMFGAINAYSLRPLPFAHPEQLLHVQYTDSESGQRRLSLPMLDWLAFRDRQTSLQSLAAYATATMNLGGLEGPPERVSGARVSTDAFATLGVQPRLGRDFLADDAKAGAMPVALIGDQLWKLRFNADPGVLGRDIRINGTPTRIVGIMPERFAFPIEESVWTPLGLDRIAAEDESAPLVNGFGRLRDGQSQPQARAEFATLVSNLAEQRKEKLRGEAASVVTLGDYFVLPQIRQANVAMFVAVLLVLLIACANVASLVMARFAARARELAVRSALGAGRSRLIQQVLCETFLLALAATLLGWLATLAAARVMEGVMSDTPAQTPYWVDFSGDARDWIFTAGIALVTALVAGLVPALRAGRVDVQAVLRQGGGIGERGRLARLLVGAEVALSLILLVGAGIAIRSAVSAQAKPLGIDTDQVMTARIGLPAARYADPASRGRFADSLSERLAQLPGVRRATVASSLPLMGYERQDYARDGEVVDRDSSLPQAWASSVGDGFFEVFGIRLREGRLFDARDRTDSVPVAVISARLAETAWPGQSAIGKHLRLSPREDGSESLEVVGVVADSVQANYFEESARLAAHRGDGNVFRPASQTTPAFFSVAVRADGDAAALGQSIREAVLAIDADQPVYWLRSMSEWRERMLWSSDLLASMFSIFAGFALLLAVAGIYAVLAFDVARRTREIGVRRAMGADSKAILGMILARAGRQVIGGLLIGLPLAWLCSRALAGLTLNGSGSDPWVYIGVVGVLLLAVLVAGLLPTRRALRVDPMVALRDE